MEAVEYRILDLKYFLQLNVVSSSLQASTLVISILKGDLATSGKHLFWLQIKRLEFHMQHDGGRTLTLTHLVCTHLDGNWVKFSLKTRRMHFLSFYVEEQ